MRWLCLCAVAVVLNAGCERSSPPAADLSGDAGTMGMGTSTPDGQTGDASDLDAFIADASNDGAQQDGQSPTSSCVQVAANDVENRMTITESGSQAQVPFATTRAFAQWDRICDPPRLLVGLGEASCTLDLGRQLVLRMEGDAIGTSLMPGGNQVEVAPYEDRIEIWYRDPDAEPTTAVWGNCTGSSGSLLIEDIGSEAGDRVTVRFDLILTDCAEPQQRPALNVVGDIDVVVPDYARVCL